MYFGYTIEFENAPLSNHTKIVLSIGDISNTKLIKNDHHFSDQGVSDLLDFMVNQIRGNV